MIEGLTFACVLWLSFKGKLGHTKELMPLLSVVAFALVASALSTIFSENLDASIPRLLEWLWLGATTLLVVRLTGKQLGRHVLVALLSAALLIQVLWSFYIWWGGRAFTNLHVGTFYAPNQYAGYLVLLGPIFLSIFLFKKRIAGTVGFGVLTALIYLSVAFSGSRGAAAAALIGVVVTLILVARPRGWTVAFKMLTLVLVFLALGRFLTGPALFPADPRASGSLMSLLSKQEGGSASTVMRAHWVKGALRIGADQPLTGSGLGTFGQKFFQIQNPSWQWSRYAHNHYLESFAEGGVLLLVSALALSFIAVGLGSRRLKRAGPEEFEWGAGLLAGLLAASLHLIVDHDWSYPAYSAAYMAAAGTLLAMGSRAQLGESAGRPFRAVVGVAAALSLLAVAGLALSRDLVVGAVMHESSPLDRARVASVLAPYSTAPRLLEADTLVAQCDVRSLRSASEALEVAASLDHLDPLIQWKLAFVLTQQRELRTAHDAYQQALEITPNSPEGYLRAARFELRYGAARQAETILDRGITRLSKSGNDQHVRPLLELRHTTLVAPTPLTEAPCKQDASVSESLKRLRSSRDLM